MSDGRVKIRSLSTGVSGLDAVLGGGLPEYSFNLIAGEPGAGKTTLAHQIVFANATDERPALYFTIVGEPTLKLLRYQQQFDFFDREKVGKSVRYHNLSDELLGGDLDAVLARIVHEVEVARAGIVVVDSFRSVSRTMEGNGTDIERFVQRLALHLTTWEVTAFLVGEYAQDEARHPVFTVADGILWLSQHLTAGMVSRKIRVVKMRGRDASPGEHGLRIGSRGVEVFPRRFPLPERQVRQGGRLGTGIPGLDEMTSGGYPRGSSVLLTGPSGSGKTSFSLRFLAEGARAGDVCAVVAFDEHPDEYVARAEGLGVDLGALIASGAVHLLPRRPLDESVDETLYAIVDLVARTGASRLVIDSLSGFEVAVGNRSDTDFRELLYRVVSAFTAADVTVVMTVESDAGSGDRPLSPRALSFLADVVVSQRYVDAEWSTTSVVSVVKMRGSAHSREVRAYTIGEGGIDIVRRAAPRPKP
jgi:circadian clock protein KaiC